MQQANISAYRGQDRHIHPVLDEITRHLETLYSAVDTALRQHPLARIVRNYGTHYYWRESMRSITGGVTDVIGGMSSEKRIADQYQQLGDLSLIDNVTLNNSERWTLYLKMVDDGGGRFHLEFYRDAARANLVAHTGAITGISVVALVADLAAPDDLKGTIGIARVPVADATLEIQFDFMFEHNGETATLANKVVPLTRKLDTVNKRMMASFSRPYDAPYTPPPGTATVLWAQTQSNWVNVAGNGSYVASKTCTDIGGSGVSGANFNIYLARPDDRDPNVRAGKVIGYLIDGNGVAVCVTDYLDDPIGSLKMWNRATPIPAGWQIADGTNGTMDLGGLFVVGYKAGDYDYGTPEATGGGKTHTHDAHFIDDHSPPDVADHPSTAVVGMVQDHTSDQIGDHTPTQVAGLLADHNAATISDHTAADVGDHGSLQITDLINNHTLENHKAEEVIACIHNHSAAGNITADGTFVNPHTIDDHTLAGVSLNIADHDQTAITAAIANHSLAGVSVTIPAHPVVDILASLEPHVFSVGTAMTGVDVNVLIPGGYGNPATVPHLGVPNSELAHAATLAAGTLPHNRGTNPVTHTANLGNAVFQHTGTDDGNRHFPHTGNLPCAGTFVHVATNAFLSHGSFGVLYHVPKAGSLTHGLLHHVGTLAHAPKVGASNLVHGPLSHAAVVGAKLTHTVTFDGTHSITPHNTVDHRPPWKIGIWIQRVN